MPSPRLSRPATSPAVPRAAGRTAATRMSHASCRCPAFTLLELMIAVVILALITALLFAAGNAITQSWGRLTREEARFSELMALDRTLDHIMTNAIPFLWTDPDTNGPKPAFLGEPDRIRLAYRHALNTLADGSLRFAGITVERGDLKIVYMERPFLTWEKPQTAWRETVMAHGVRGLRLQYADWDPGEKAVVWYEDWDPERLELPLGIVVTVTWEDGREECWLRRTAGAGYYERFGNWRPAPQTSR